ncbi:MAG: hypothetical protein AAF493_26195 [Pseudomonadota bacterium]
MQLRQLQTHLERTYEVSIPHDVDDFIVSQSMTGGPGHEVEQLIIVEGPNDTLDVGLYIEHSIVDSLSDDDPALYLHDGNLANFCVALEGVSHFLYLIWRAAHERTVSLLELELQAEVDKFVLAAALFAHQRRGQIPSNLTERLFNEITFDPALDDETRNRYQSANHYAKKYCQWLSDRFLRRPASGLTTELRRFYRLPGPEKIRAINAAAPAAAP